MGFWKKVKKFTAKVGSSVYDYGLSPTADVFGIIGRSTLSGIAYLHPANLGSLIDFGIDEPDTPSYADNIGNTMSSSAPVPLGFGRVKTGGNVVRISPSGNTRAFIVSICEGPINAYSGVSVNGIGWSALRGVIKGEHTKTEYSGTSVQTTDSRFVDKAQTYRNTAYLAFTFNIKQEQKKEWKQVTADPTITSVIEAKMIPPIAGGSDTFSRNPAVIYWYVYTVLEGRSSADLNTTEFQALETYCDAVPDGGTLPRYLFDYIFETPTSVTDIKKLLDRSFNGTCIWSEGQIKPVWEKSADPVYHFTLNNIVAGSFSWSQPDSPNIVRVQYLDSDNDFKKEIIELRDETSIAEKGEIIHEENAYFITHKELARRRLQLLFNRFKYTNYICQFTGLPSSSILELYDIVTVTHTMAGFVEKKFIVKEKSEDEWGRCTFTLHAYHSAIYDDRAAEIQDGYYPVLPDPYEEPSSVTNLLLYESSTTGPDGVYVPTVHVSFDPPTDINAVYWQYGEIWTRTRNTSAAPDALSGTTWTYYDRSSSGNTVVVDGIKASFYGYIPGGVSVDIAVRSVNEHGVAQGISSSVSDTEIIDELPWAYFTVSPTPGLGMFTTVTAALAALPSGGGQITLLEGTHVLASGTSMPGKAVDLRGVNRKSVIVQNAASEHGFIVMNVDKSYRFSNFTIQSQNTTPDHSAMIMARATDSDIEIDSVNFELTDKGIASSGPWAAGDRGIHITSNTGFIRINNCDFADGCNAIYTGACQDIIISNSSTTDSKHYSIYLNLSGKNRYQVSDNNIRDFRYGALYSYLGSGGVSKAVVTGNVFTRHSGATPGPGSLFYGVITSGLGMQFVNNSFYGENLIPDSRDYYGVILTGGTNGCIKGNIVDFGSGVSIDTNVLYAMYLGPTSHNQIIEGNYVKALNLDSQADPYTAHGILMGGNNCIVNNNIVAMNDKAKDCGFYLGGDYCRGADNNAIDTGVHLDDVGANNNVVVTDISGV